MEQIIDRLKKIKTLADRGESGEAIAAKHQLDKLLEKYDVSIEQLMCEERSTRKFKVQARHEQLFYQVCLFVAGNKAKNMWHYKGKRSGKYVDLTDSEYIDIEQLFEFHKKQFDKERKKLLKSLEVAYPSKHRLFNCDKNESDTKGKKMSHEEYLEILRMINLLDDVTFFRKLPTSFST